MVVEHRSRSTAPADGLPAGPSALGRTAAWLSKQLERALAEVDLSLPQYRILGMLAEGASMPSALAERLAVRRPTVTAVVDGLAARGLVERSPADDDRRIVTHTLTAKGKRLLAKADAAADGRLVAIARSLDDAGSTARALEGLELWRSALRAHFVAQMSGNER
ncbi:MAG TPA: MarR family transcriptional regulator [Acidimicrobiales bacterium]|nr:MarR family transcriptional regulator [Acidimicrobiales bacterium]